MRHAYQKIRVGDRVYWKTGGGPTDVGSGQVLSKEALGRLRVTLNTPTISDVAALYAEDVIRIERNDEEVL